MLKSLATVASLSQPPCTTARSTRTLSLVDGSEVAAESASLVMSFAAVGLGPDTGVSWTLSRLAGPARAWEPKRLRLRLFSAAGRIVHGGRRLRIAATWSWVTQLTAAITRLQALAPG